MCGNTSNNLFISLIDVMSNTLHLMMSLLHLTCHLGVLCHWVLFPALHLTPSVGLLRGRRILSVPEFHTASGVIQHVPRWFELLQ